MTQKVLVNLLLKPRNDFVFIQVEQDDLTDGGIALPQIDTSKPGQYRGMVLDTGPDVKDLEQMDKVLFYSDRTTAQLANGKMVLVKQEDVLGVFNE